MTVVKGLLSSAFVNADVARTATTSLFYALKMHLPHILVANEDDVR